MSKLRANQLTDKASTGAPTAPNGLVVTGVSTATSFSGSGANLTTLNAGNVSSGTLPTTRGGTGLTSLGSAGQSLKVNSGANGLEYGDVGILQRVYSWIDNTQVCPPSVTSGSSTGSNVFSYTITAKTANPYYEINWNFFWGLSTASGDSNEINAIAGIFNSSNQLVYGFGYKKPGATGTDAGGSSTYRSITNFRSQTNDYVLFDNDSGVHSTDNNWQGMPVSITSFGNRLESDNGAPGRCGDGGTTGVSAGDTLTLKGWVGSGSAGCYNRTTNNVTKADYAIITLKEYSSIGQ